MDTFDRLKKALVDCLGLREDAVTPTANFRDDLGLDSLELVEVAMVAEEEFRITMTDDAMDRISTVGELVAHVDQFPAVLA